MRPRAGALLVGVALAAVLVACGSGPGAAAGGAATAVQEPDDATWNGTYTPGPERGGFRDGIATADGGYLLVGYLGADHEDDHGAVAMKVDAAGDLEWVWSLQGYGHATLASAVQVDDGRVLVAGTRSTDDADPRRLVVALTADGDLLWRDTYGEGTVSDAARVHGGGVLVAGGGRATVITPNGARVWDRRYDDAAFHAAARLEDGYVLAGAGTDGGPRNRLLVRTDATGDVVWRATRSGDGPDRFTDVAVDDDVLYAGGAAPLGEGSDVHPSVSAFHANGSHDWSRTHRGETRIETVVALALADPGTVAAVRRDADGPLERFGTSVAGRSTDVEARLTSVTAVGSGRYLVTGVRDGEAWAGVLEPDFASAAGDDTSEPDGDDGADRTGDAGPDGSGAGDGGGLPAVPGVPSTLTMVLVAVAAVASLAAVAVTLLSLRHL